MKNLILDNFNLFSILVPKFLQVMIIIVLTHF